MAESDETKAIALGLVCAAIGGCIGYFAFFWIARQGFYALVIPPGLLGWAAGLGARRRSSVLAAVCGAGGLALGLFTEWRFAPFIADGSFSYFITHLHRLQPVTMLMLGFGVFLSYTLALGRHRAARDSS